MTSDAVVNRTEGPPGRGEGFGVYIHVPFCAHRCDYCAFATWTGRAHLVDGYLDACRREVERAVAAGMPEATSVFVGGGTPSLVPAAGLMAVVAAVPVTVDAEVTVECNPDTVTEPLLDTYAEGGVNRLSFGVQSMLPHVLKALGRTHDPDNVRRSIESARAVGFTNWNVDLIYGGAGESVADWRRSLDEVVALEPPHVSAYGLTVEPGTALADDPSRWPDDDDQADKYLLAAELLGRAGLEWYEISNWSRPGHRCRHNLLYWREGEYLGCGCAAHSHRGGRRWWNVRTPERYLAAIDAGRSAEAAGERLAADERRLEALQLAVRTADGVPSSSLPVDELDGLVEVDDGRAVLTVRGRLLASEVALRLR
ncbi:MAG: radical SAM family heme chaperone HemW [Acidimicrobiales bacterium]